MARKSRHVRLAPPPHAAAALAAEQLVAPVQAALGLVGREERCHVSVRHRTALRGVQGSPELFRVLPQRRHQAASALHRSADSLSHSALSPFGGASLHTLHRMMMMMMTTAASSGLCMLRSRARQSKEAREGKAREGKARGRGRGMDPHKKDKNRNAGSRRARAEGVCARPRQTPWAYIWGRELGGHQVQ